MPIPGTITGSIGVIAEWYNYGDLLRWAKMQSVVIKSGAFKDAGSGTRPLTEEEKVYFQSLINNMYGQFVSAVATSRNMKDEDGAQAGRWPRVHRPGSQSQRSCG